MNRIRKYGKIYQVLITPTQSTNATFELMMGDWADSNLRNYYVLEYDTLGDAMVEAFKYPDIDWDKMVLMHKN